MNDLSGEIELLRVQIHRYLKAETQVEEQLTYDDRLVAMRAASQAADSLTRLIRLQAHLNLENTEWKEIEDALNALDLEEEDDDLER